MNSSRPQTPDAANFADDEFAVPLRPDGSEDYRKQKLQATWVNMIIALLACVALMVGVLMIVPQPQGNATRVVDSVAAGQTAQHNLGWNVAYIDLPEGWTSNEAHVADLGIPAQPTWYASYVGPHDQWISVQQSHGDVDWAESVLEDYVAGSARTFAEVDFTEYHSSTQQRAFVGKIGQNTVIISAVALDETVEEFATRVVEKLQS